MAEISIKVLDQNGKTLAVSRGENEANLVYSEAYQEGDRIIVDTFDKNDHYWIQVDDALGHSLMFLKEGTFAYPIPFGSKRINLSPKAFSGSKHLLHVRKARPFEYLAYRNLSQNVNDHHDNSKAFPHASANVETRGESVFAAMNAVDGVTAAASHGEWPYQSWGINQRPDAELTLDFGRLITMDRIVFYLRADFPHDNWWERVTIEFSDGSEQEFALTRTGEAQEFCIEPKSILWLKMKNMKKADEPSPFPALTQIEVYGKEAD